MNCDDDGPSVALAVRQPFAEEAVIAVVAWKVRRAPAGTRHDHVLVEDFNFDSIDLIELVLAVGRGLQIKVDDKEAAQIRVVGDLLSVASRAYQAALTPL